MLNRLFLAFFGALQPVRNISTWQIPPKLTYKRLEVFTWGLPAASNYSAGWVFMEFNMKKIVLAAAFASIASTAFAGGMSEPMMEMDPVVIVEESGSSSSGTGAIVALILVALLAAAS